MVGGESMIELTGWWVGVHVRAHWVVGGVNYRAHWMVGGSLLKLSGWESMIELTGWESMIELTGWKSNDRAHWAVAGWSMIELTGWWVGVNDSAHWMVSGSQW